MKKTFIATLVGALIIFFWQFLSNAALDLHRPTQQYTPKQDTILSFLSSQLQEGRYFMPTYPDGATTEDRRSITTSAAGQPWAVVEYHRSLDVAGMPMNLLRGILVNWVLVWLLVWLIGKKNDPGFVQIVLSSLAVGFMGFLNQPYTQFIWYPVTGIWIDLLDMIISWGLTGLWLGWYMRKKG